MAERNTPRRSGGYEYVEAYDVAAATKIEAGKLVMLNAGGNALEGQKAAGLICVGRCEETVDNSAGAAGDLKVRVRTGIFRWNNDVAGAALTKANIGDTVYVEDDETVRSDSNANGQKVGRLIAVDAQGAWVATGIPFLW